jgi:N-acetylglucosamine-6-phosphate deacetylase
MLGLTDRGRLAVGARADLCHMDADLALTGVWAGGVAVPR